MASIHRIVNGREERHEVALNVTMYREAAEAGLTLQQHLERQFGANLDPNMGPSVFAQLCAAEGIHVRANRELGFRASTMAEILEGRTAPQAGVVTKDAVPTSRLLFPAVILQTIEDKLLTNLDMTATALDAMIAVDESIDSDRFEQAVLNFDKPAAARSQGIAQLARPASMGVLTTSERQGNIPTFSLGLEISDQALRAFPLDFVALSIARQIAVERNERAQQYMLAMLNGDVDNGQASLASLGAGHYVNASTLDAASTGGNLTQLAWTKYMIRKATQRTITNIVCDVDTLMKIENRANRPTSQTDNPTSPRINTQFQVSNPLWPAQVNAFITVDSAWPANTIMGLDRRYAMRRVRNLSATYEAMEAYVMRRSKEMRFDFGEIITRLYDDAFDVMVLA